MFSKVFEQIYDSSIAEDYLVRFVFEDFLTLADVNGVVDRTPEAISRRTNVPIDIVKRSIVKLESPDPKSRRPDDDGRRIVRLDEHRDWGWFIVNYEYYRNLASEEQRRDKTRERVNKYRQNLKCNAPVTQCNDSPYASSSSFLIPSSLNTSEFHIAWGNWQKHRSEIKKKLTPSCAVMQLKEFESWGITRSIRAIEYTIKKGWQGIKEPEENSQAGKTIPTSQQKTSAYMLTKRLEIIEGELGTARNFGKQDDIHRLIGEIKETKQRIKDATK